MANQAGPKDQVFWILLFDERKILSVITNAHLQPILFTSTVSKKIRLAFWPTLRYNTSVSSQNPDQATATGRRLLKTKLRSKIE